MTCDLFESETWYYYNLSSQYSRCAGCHPINKFALSPVTLQYFLSLISDYRIFCACGETMQDLATLQVWRFPNLLMTHWNRWGGTVDTFHHQSDLMHFKGDLSAYSQPFTPVSKCNITSFFTKEWSGRTAHLRSSPLNQFFLFEGVNHHSLSKHYLLSFTRL